MSTLQEHMQDWPLTLDRILEHAQRWQGARKVLRAQFAATAEASRRA
jgi:hypothetical protein